MLRKGYLVISARLKADMQASTLLAGRLTVDDEVVRPGKGHLTSAERPLRSFHLLCGKVIPKPTEVVLLISFCLTSYNV